ncbi:SDR family NAD(P)-dependent oxidoreductase [Chitinimonas sp.]|uniref:SDR family NAD(P)-dependent oxidoreductase n=1 Tax=Chitinimonas sp. TaxID=1934313 RepID=UPI0035AF69D2
MNLLPALNPRLVDWAGKRVWLVGASTGIGAALAKALAAQGARVAVSARHAERLQALAGSLPEAQALPMDATCDADWARCHASLQHSWGGIDLLVFCAADYRPQRAWEVSSASAARTMDLNLISAYRALEHALPAMLARGSGGFALIASVAGYMGLPNATVYGPSKAALINLAEVLYADLHPRGLGVYLINPGFVETPLTAQNQFTMPALQTPEQAASAIVRGLAQGRFEIDFPKRFTRSLRWISLLPHRWRFALLERTLHLS